jgi:hypothetical protein
MGSQSAQRRNIVFLGFVVLSVFLSAFPVLGSTFTVTNTNDSGPGRCGMRLRAPLAATQLILLSATQPQSRLRHP